MLAVAIVYVWSRLLTGRAWSGPKMANKRRKLV
jgi:hypothetical protein